MAHAVVQQQNRDGRHDQRQDDTEDDDDVIRAVDVSGFLQRLRHALNRRTADDGVIHGDHARQDQRPEGVVQTEVTDVQVGRDHAAAEEHGEHDHEHDGLLEHHALAGQEVAAEQGHEDIQRQRDTQNDQDVLIAGEDQRMLKGHLVGTGGETMRPEQDTLIGNEIAVFGEGGAKHVPHRIQRNKAQGNQDNRIDSIENLVARRLLDLHTIVDDHFFFLAHTLPSIRTDQTQWSSY